MTVDETAGVLTGEADKQPETAPIEAEPTKEASTETPAEVMSEDTEIAAPREVEPESPFQESMRKGYIG